MSKVYELREAINTTTQNWLDLYGKYVGLEEMLENPEASFLMGSAIQDTKKITKLTLDVYENQETKLENLEKEVGVIKKQQGMILEELRILNNQLRKGEKKEH